MTELEKAALLDKNTARKISEKMDDIERIAESSAGKTVQSILEKNGDRLTKAYESNDTAALTAELDNILKTEAGAKVISQLAKLLD